MYKQKYFIIYIDLFRKEGGAIPQAIFFTSLAFGHTGYS